MISIQKIRDDKSSVAKELSKKDKSISLDNIVKSDSELRDLTKNCLLYTSPSPRDS